MQPYLTTQYGNAGALYSFGRETASAVQTARGQASALFGCEPENVVFTSGGSESNSMVFHGVCNKLRDSGRTHLVVSAIEHDSVLRAAEQLARDGFELSYVQPDRDGTVPTGAVERALQPNTGLVSVMYANNETGAVNDVHSIGALCRSRGILFHTDCVQAAGQYQLNVGENFVDFASVSAHKIHGVKGVGALYVRDLDIAPLVCGGERQEFGLRGGTENVPGIVAFGKACELAVENMEENLVVVSTLKQLFYTMLNEKLMENGVDTSVVQVNAKSVIKPGKILSLTFHGVDAESLLLMMDAKYSVCASAGSACSANSAKPSHVLRAMGLTTEDARSTVRFSFSKYNTYGEIKFAALCVANCILSLLYKTT